MNLKGCKHIFFIFKVQEGKTCDLLSFRLSVSRSFWLRKNVKKKLSHQPQNLTKKSILSDLIKLFVGNLYFSFFFSRSFDSYPTG